MIRLFRTNHPSVYLYLLLYALVLKASLFFIPYDVHLPARALLGKMYLEYEGGFSALTHHIVAIILVYVQALLVNYLHASSGLTERQTHVPALIYLTLTSLLPEFIVLSQANIAYTFILAGFTQLFAMPDEQHGAERMFYTTLLFSFSGLIYWPASVFLLAVFFAMFWLRSSSGREFLLVLVAFLLPYYFVGIVYYLNDSLYIYEALLFNLLPSEFSSPGFDKAMYGLMIYVGIVGLLTAGDLPRSGQLNIIKLRKYYQVVVVTLVILVNFFFTVRAGELFYLYLCILPFTILFTPVFNREKVGWLRRILFWGFIAWCIYFQWREVLGWVD